MLRLKSSKGRYDMSTLQIGDAVFWDGYGVRIEGTITEMDASGRMMLDQKNYYIPWLAQEINGSLFAYSGTNTEGESTFDFPIREIPA